MKKIAALFITMLMVGSVLALPRAHKTVNTTPIDTIDVVCHDLQLNTDFNDL